MWWLQDGSADITQIDNEFHRVRYVDFETGELKHAFISFEEKLGVGSFGQLECLRKSVVSLYPAEDHANLENILELIQAHHIPPVSDEMEDLPQPVENNFFGLMIHSDYIVRVSCIKFEILHLI